MNTNQLSQHTQDVLKKYGWYEGRKFDITFWVSKLEGEGYRLHEYAELILKELGDIYVGERATKAYEGATFDFNPYYSASGEYDRLEEFEMASGDKLFPIGAFQDYIVYAGQTKRIYLGCWACLYMIGNSIEEYLENVFKKGYEPIEIMLDR
ncbi:MAG: SUKH-3 domain-containing protein [Clostridium sp.]|nr:SUKH-3 domain-containing protein [Clostridium sp.]